MVTLVLIIIILTIYHLHHRYGRKAYPLFNKGNRTAEEAFETVTGIDITKEHGDKGAVGEFKIFKSIWENFDDVLLFGNVYLPMSGDKNRTTEVDLMAIHSTGIYVIESKNYNGNIKGDDDSEQWSYDTRSGTYEFYSPIKQNRTHIRAVVNQLEYAKRHLVSYIVFGENSNLDRVYVDNTRVLTVDNVVEQLRYDIGNRPKKYSKLEIIRLTIPFWKHSLPTQEDKEKHVRGIRRMLNKKGVTEN